MTITAQKRKGKCKLTVDGEMTIYTAVDQKGALMKHLPGCGEVRIDLSRVTEMDTAGLQLLLLAQRESAREDKAFHLLTPSKAVREVLEIYNMAEHLAKGESQSYAGKPAANADGASS